MSTFAGDRLFERQPSPAELREWTLALAQDNGQATVEETISSMVFEVAGEVLAFPTLDLQEVLEPVPIHRVPGRAGSLLRGLVNIRGRLELCVSLEHVLGIPAAPLVQDRAPKMLLAGREGRRFAFLTHRVIGIAKIPRSALAEYHEGQHIRQRFTWDRRLVGMLDLATLHDAVLDGLRR